LSTVAEWVSKTSLMATSQPYEQRAATRRAGSVTGTRFPVNDLASVLLELPA
jgi:hypothetical protein